MNTCSNCNKEKKEMWYVSLENYICDDCIDHDKPALYRVPRQGK